MSLFTNGLTIAQVTQSARHLLNAVQQRHGRLPGRGSATGTDAHGGRGRGRGGRLEPGRQGWCKKSLEHCNQSVETLL